MLISPMFFIVSPDLGLAPVDPGAGGVAADLQCGLR
jgi:hypothetical protein